MPQLVLPPEERLIEDIKRLNHSDWKKVRNYVTKLRQLERMDAKVLSKLVFAGEAHWDDENRFDDNELVCSFCGASYKFVSKLTSGKDGYICDECVAACNNLLTDVNQAEKELKQP